MTTCICRPGSRRVRSRFRIDGQRGRETRETPPNPFPALIWSSAAIAFLFSCNILGYSGAVDPAPPEVPAATSGSDSVSLAGGGSSHPVYPFSVIPGGAQSQEELTQALENDPVVAAHYAGFEASRARMIAAGEALITDGANLARESPPKDVSPPPSFAFPLAVVLPIEPGFPSVTSTKPQAPWIPSLELPGESAPRPVKTYVPWRIPVPYRSHFPACSSA